MTRHRTGLGIAARCLGVAALLGAVTACGSSDPGFSTKSSGPTPDQATPAPTASPSSGTDSAPRVTATIASKLSVPWGVAFLPDGSALVTERDSGRVLRIVPGRQPVEIGRIDETRAEGEAGLLGIAVSPDFAENRRIFVYVTSDSDNRVLRMRLVDGKLTDQQAILTGIPKGFIHDGGRLLFDKSDHLFVSTGEVGQAELSQDSSSLAGKILRITEDGDPAPGNPSSDSPVWTIGHRNVQGLAFDSQGNLWASEFGNSAYDELNLIQKGTNYGWPNVEGKSDEARFRNPQIVWQTETASPSGLAFLDGHLWLGALQGQRLWRVDVKGKRASHPTDFLVGRYGRLRTVVAAPDGTLWVTTSNRDGRGNPTSQDDRILQVTP